MTLDEAFADARNCFPNFPSVIFSLWLDERIRANGWPPAGPEWDGFLWSKSIGFWQGVTWKHRILSLSPKDFASESLKLCNQILEAASGEINLISTYIPNTKERFNACLQYLQINKTIPGALLLLQDIDGFSTIDGNHRLAALFKLQSLLPIDILPFSVSAWVATPR